MSLFYWTQSMITLRWAKLMVVRSESFLRAWLVAWPGNMIYYTMKLNNFTHYFTFGGVWEWQKWWWTLKWICKKQQWEEYSMNVSLWRLAAYQCACGSVTFHQQMATRSFLSLSTHCHSLKPGAQSTICSLHMFPLETKWQAFSGLFKNFSPLASLMPIV